METVVVPISAGTSAGTAIALPKGALPISQLVSAALSKRVDITHAACGATGAAYASATTLGTPLNSLTALEVVTGTPSSGQIAKASDTEVVLGDDVSAGDVLIVTYIAKHEMSGF